MIKNDRQEQILEIIKKDKYASVQKLAKLTYASLPTIRRDLDYLSQNGYISRSHGGAAIISPSSVTPVDYRIKYAQDQKKTISKKAAAFIRDGMVIFIDESTSASYLISELTKFKNITVITNGFVAINLLKEANINFFCIGGEMCGECFAGSYAENFVRNFNADICFFSATSVSEDGKIADNDKFACSLKKTMLEYSKKKVFLVDDTKLNLYAIYNVSNIENINCTVTTIPKEKFTCSSERILTIQQK